MAPSNVFLCRRNRGHHQSHHPVFAGRPCKNHGYFLHHHCGLPMPCSPEIPQRVFHDDSSWTRNHFRWLFIVFILNRLMNDGHHSESTLYSANKTRDDRRGDVRIPPLKFDSLDVPIYRTVAIVWVDVYTVAHVWLGRLSLRQLLFFPLL
jgi:hypothetical protein